MGLCVCFVQGRVCTDFGCVLALVLGIRAGVRSRPISTTTAPGGFGAAPGVPDKILGDKMAGAVVVKKAGPAGGWDFVHHHRSGHFIAQDLVWSPGGCSKPPSAVVVDIFSAHKAHVNKNKNKKQIWGPGSGPPCPAEWGSRVWPGIKVKCGQ